ncbi:MAG: hypothetical protein Q8930_16380 [Bacillota bacterium]|nr:hypothetical protein [Bacillota bacterium]
MKKGNGVTRKYAERVLLEIPVIADNINKDNSHLQLITKIAVYGSYISSDKEILGDLDLAVEVVNRYEGEEFTKRLNKFAESFTSGSSLDRMFKAANYIYKCLVNGRKCLHINPYMVLEASGLSEGSGYKIVYNLEK